MPGRDYVGYVRVSTDRQGDSGLGLEAQRKAIGEFLKGGKGRLIAEFTEVESGKLNSRPQLAAAVEACKRHKAILVIAKLDRLARNVAFIANLLESGVEFVATDNPHANKLMLHLLAAFAEHEREQISERTKAALAAAKARGVRLGSYGPQLAAQNRRRATEFAIGIKDHIQQLRSEGFTSVRDLVSELNRRNIAAPRGGKWHVPTVYRLLGRIEALPT